MKKNVGFTLIEAVISMAIIAASVAGSLIIMGKLASVTAKKGDIMTVLTASAVAQYTVDEVRDINFPPLKTMEKLEYDGDSEDYPIDTDYEFRRKITDSAGATIPEANYGSGGIDSILSDQNLLKVAVAIYKNGKPLMTTYTYKVRNGTF